MKKIIIAIISLVLLTACSNKAGYAKLDDDEVLFYNDKVSYTKNDLFTILKSSSESVVLQDLIKDICEIQEVDVDSLQIEAQENVDLIVSYGDYFVSYLTSQYGSVENYKNLYLVSLMEYELFKNYVKENIATYVSTDSPVKMQYGSFDNIDQAQAVLDDVGQGTSFDTAVLNNGYTGDASPFIFCSNDSSLNTNVAEYVNSTDTTGISSIITYTTTTTGEDGSEVDTNTYYVVNVVSRDYNDFLDDYVDNVLEDLNETDILNNIFAKYDIKFYDQSIYDQLVASYSSLKVK